MLYYPQKLVEGTINSMFNKIHNCKIGRPTWSKNDSYCKEFFIYKRKGIGIGTSIVGEVTDRKILEGVEYILLRNGTELKIMYKNGSGYTQLGNSKTINNNNPITFEKGVSARGIEKATGVKIGDAFFALNDKGTYNAGTTYLSNEIVLYSGQYYVSLSGSIGKLPTNKDYWILYDKTNSGLASGEPPLVNYNDEFKGGYLVLKLEGPGIDSLVTAGEDYVYFYEDKSNLQGIAVQVEYKKTLDANNILVYIKGTNKAGSRPLYSENSSLTEKVAIYNNVGDCPVITTSDGVYIYNVKENSSGNIIGAKEVKLINLDNIIDMCEYNGVIFILNNKRLYYSHITNQGFSNVNIYPLDFINIRGGQKLIPFGKMLVLLGIYDKIVTPINGTGGNVGFVSTDLNFEEDLFSKYSILSYMGSLYMIKSNKELVKINIVSINNISYQVESSTVLKDTKGIIDNIEGEVYMGMDDKDLIILNHRNNNTYSYIYNVEYGHWSTGEYKNKKIYKILKGYYYGDNIYVESDEEEFTQEISFVVGTDDLAVLKTFIFYKMILGIESKILDYYLDIEYEIGGTISSATVELSNYPINMELDTNSLGLGDTQIGTSLLGLSMLDSFIINIGNIISPNIGIGKTASLMRFTLRSKPTNGIVYGGSVVGYELCIPQITEVGYKH